MTEAMSVVVIGGGPGGYTAAIRAAQLGRDVTLVEGDGVGGTCLNHGCIPSKALLSATGLVNEIETACSMGIYAEPYVEVGELFEWKEDVVDRLTGGVESLCRAHGVELLEGRASFVDDHTVAVDGHGPDRLAFEDAVVATGSRPIELPGLAFDYKRVVDARGALALKSVPSQLVVVGAGYIGMELSTAFARLGSEVTVLEALESALPGYDDELVAPVIDRAKSLDVEFRFEHRVTGLGRNGAAITAETADGEVVTFPADRVLVAVGREPVTDTAGLDAVGVDTTGDGFLETDAQCRTSADGVYAVGDVTGEPMLAHKASAEGRVVGSVLGGEEVSFDPQAVPAAVFTDPEIGTVGLTEAEAREADRNPVVGRFPFGASGRALALGREDGFVRVVTDGNTGRVLGGAVVGPEASELIAELAVAVEQELTFADLVETVHVHPTLSEAVMEAAESAFGHAIHALDD
jgi:dihydrolipoamide dehydrogenase